jgi:hypothetical protein
MKIKKSCGRKKKSIKRKNLVHHAETCAKGKAYLQKLRYEARLSKKHDCGKKKKKKADVEEACAASD